MTAGVRPAASGARCYPFIMVRASARLLLGAFVVAAATTVGCAAPESLPDVTGGPQIGLQRGHAWSTFTVKPPHIVGPSANLVLRKNILSGVLGGAPVRVKIANDGADGFAPAGPVALTYKNASNGLDVSGMWNGGRIHFLFTNDSLRGTVRSVVEAAPPGLDGQDVSPYASCEYVLTERGKDGALSGVSICSGMPQRTRLEVPHVIQAWMTRSELVVLLVALLSAPRSSISEPIPFPRSPI